ncbi:MAG: WGR domain-containing protein [Burkholderiaceae bacterium]|nr:MAG: WGR domain-containing protein [Burkholderiaceae bacterium]TBR76823.1 MAG: WGR domain-containing protein [Burkholderiaceae bacterium]
MSTADQQPQSVHLYFTEGSSDKVYQAHLREQGSGWVCDFAYGPRGGSLKTGTKTSSPTSYAEALKAYTKLVKEKTSKGYTPDQSGTLYTSSELAGRKSGELPQLPTAIEEQDLDRYMLDPNWGLQEKADGENRILIIEGHQLQGTNRLGLFVDLPKHWGENLQGFSGRTVIAGEHVGDCYLAFDLLELNGADLRHQPFRIRYRRLMELHASFVTEWMNVLRLDISTDVKRRRAASILENNGEGYVLKDLNAPFASGRSAVSLKFKFQESSTCEVIRVNAKRSVAVGLRDSDGAMVDMGNVTIPSNEVIPQVGALVEVRYLYRFANGKFEQPVYKGPRPDMTPQDAVLSQVKRIKVRGASTDSEPDAGSDDELETESAATQDQPRA